MLGVGIMPMPMPIEMEMEMEMEMLTRPNNQAMITLPVMAENRFSN